MDTKVNVISKEPGFQKVEFKDRVYYLTQKDSRWHIANPLNTDVWHGFKTLKLAKQYMLENFK